MIPSLERLVQDLVPAFTEPTFQTHCQLLLGWLMCLGARNPYRVCQARHADQDIPRSQRHPFDRFYNFFSRSAWAPADLGYQVAVLAVTLLNPLGLLYYRFHGVARPWPVKTCGYVFQTLATPVS